MLAVATPLLSPSVGVETNYSSSLSEAGAWTRHWVQINKLGRKKGVLLSSNIIKNKLIARKTCSYG